MKIQGASDSSPTGHGQSVTVKQIGKKRVKYTDIGDFGLVQMEAGAEQGVRWGMQLQVRRCEFDPELLGVGQWRGRCGRSPRAQIGYFYFVLRKRQPGMPRDVDRQRTEAVFMVYVDGVTPVSLIVFCA